MKSTLLFFLISCISFFSKIIVCAQAPDLGGSAGFALFTASGDFGNTGSTVIWGDVGTFAGAYSGTQTGIGNVHVADAVATTASSDVLTAYSSMEGESCDSTLGTPFGSGLVLRSDKGILPNNCLNIRR